MARLLPALAASLAALCVLVLGAPSAVAEIYEYVDSQGRLHFTQDITQVPTEYRHQVEKKVLKKSIRVTGEGSGISPRERVRAMEKRSKKLQGSRPKAAPAAPATRKNPLAGAAEPRKYDKECWYGSGGRRCRKWLTPQWQAWDRANGGNNGKPTTRRRIGVGR